MNNDSRFLRLLNVFKLDRNVDELVRNLRSLGPAPAARFEPERKLSIDQAIERSQGAINKPKLNKQDIVKYLSGVYKHQMSDRADL